MLRALDARSIHHMLVLRLSTLVDELLESDEFRESVSNKVNYLVVDTIDIIVGNTDKIDEKVEEAAQDAISRLSVSL